MDLLFRIQPGMGPESSSPVLQFVLGALLMILCLPLVPHRKIRYYACYVAYIGVTLLLAVILLPVFALRPRNIRNLRFAASILRHLTKVIGINWELRNGEILRKDRAAVIAANHQTILDILGMYNIWEIMEKCTVVAKKELLYILPFGPTAWLAGLVFIDRHNPKLANSQLSEASRVIHSERAKFWMFPEGTRNMKQQDLLPFKKGAFRIAIECKVPIIPVVYSPYYFIDSKNKAFDEGKIIISVLDEISTEGMTLDDVDKLKDMTYKVMSEEWERLKDEISVHRQKKISSSS